MAKDEINSLGGDRQFNTTEIWAPIPSEPGMHASSYGRVLLAPMDLICPSCGNEFRRGAVCQNYCSSKCFGRSRRRLSEEDELLAESLLKSGKQIKTVAEIFGVGRGAISRIKNNIITMEARA